ncbi:threonine-phosphate decarboxylase [Neorhizobium alkalisoli]|uniref:Aminotransferase n=1 Tax=Neorhizobium alkalisoli TaxID=528178 RepID=A0A561PZ75_9HYPH|nr:threonine-phosphate decarboxylase [Neorhizobium alkalisoli]TWF43405.1 histidinol-phosphate/aromatic aminotransferase/cobyric acid decarboxylase-like protein [Neorhizobium alkalisoli]
MAGPDSGENKLGGPIQHGGNLGRARKLFPQAPEPWIDLSTGINPHSYPYSPIPANVFARLPEPVSLEGLKAVAAHAYGAPSAAHLAAGPGTQILLPIVAGLLDGWSPLAKTLSGLPAISPTRGEKTRGSHSSQSELGRSARLSPPPWGEGGEGFLPEADERPRTSEGADGTHSTKPRRIAAVLSPTYAEHARAARMAGFSVTETDDLETLAAADLAVIVNPNNPTGRIVPKADLLALADVMRAKGGLLIVDEAFMDVSEAESVANAVDAGGLVVLRSFGKFYGMAGLRLGFALAHPDIITRIEERLGPWAVSGPALHVASEALADTAWQQAMRKTLKAEATRLDAALASAGLAVLGGTSLFRLVRDPRAQALYRHLGEHGILTRRFEERPDDLRIGLPEADGRARLEAALKTF